MDNFTQYLLCVEAEKMAGHEGLVPITVWVLPEERDTYLHNSLEFNGDTGAYLRDALRKGDKVLEEEHNDHVIVIHDSDGELVGTLHELLGDDEALISREPKHPKITNISNNKKE